LIVDRQAVARKRMKYDISEAILVGFMLIWLQAEMKIGEEVL
jgi:hypothetical protein